MCVLVALSFPAVSYIQKHRENARCVSNLRSVGSLVLAFVSDHNGMIPPPYADDLSPEQAKVEGKGWVRRLYNKGYITESDLPTFLCPSFKPKSVQEVVYNGIRQDAGQSYGMRYWTVPSAPDGNSANTRTHKPVSLITKPASFFLIADSYWAASNWKSQGYAISAARNPNTSSNRVHVRHSGKANAFFLDGHVEAKDRDYFLRLTEDPEQAPYIGGIQGNRYRFAVENEIPDDASAD